MSRLATLDAFTTEIPDHWYCPWCGSRDIAASETRPGGYYCRECEAIQPTDAEWYPEMIFA